MMVDSRPLPLQKLVISSATYQLLARFFGDESQEMTTTWQRPIRDYQSPMKHSSTKFETDLASGLRLVTFGDEYQEKAGNDQHKTNYNLAFCSTNHSPPSQNVHTFTYENDWTYLFNLKFHSIHSTFCLHKFRKWTPLCFQFTLSYRMD